MFLDTHGVQTGLQQGDVAFLQVSHGAGHVKMRIERGGHEVLRWRRHPEDTEGASEEYFQGIMCPMEIERSLAFLARGFGLEGVRQHEVTDEHKKMGWLAWCLI